jgi:hypothetical protein
MAKTEHWTQRLDGACSEGMEWAKKYPNAKEAWEACSSPAWMIWWLIKARRIDKKQSVSIAIYCAELVLPNFVKKYPDDKRPEQAIQAAKNWLANPNAASADAAASAAYAASAAAASAAYAASAAAADAADADARKNICDHIRKEFPEAWK